MKVKAGKRIKDFNFLRFKTAEIKGNVVKPANDFFEFKKEEIQQLITRRFKQQVNMYPGSIAIKTENRSITYLELDNISAQIAQTLSEVTPRSRQGVALLFEKGIDMVAGMLGALKARHFYIPLDPTYPNKRLIYMVKDSNARLILTNTGNYPLALQLAKDARQNLELINIGELDKTFSPPQSLSPGKPGVQINPGYPAYILYTSGSTGLPKGVAQNHRNVLHFIREYTNRLHINPRDRLIMLCSYSFDAAVMDIYGALLNGATLYPFDLKQQDGINRLPGWLKEEKITIFHSIPTVFRYLSRQLTGKEQFPDLRLVVMGGEAVYKTDVENFKRYFSNDCLFINGLGPTESTVTLQYFMDKNSEINKEAVPVGFPVEDTEVLLIDKNKREAPVYGSGEIVFKSDYLALGYLNHPEKTCQVFGKEPLTGKGRVFRSGDVGKRLPDGNIEYIGRKDQQVKIRGYRIEPVEIEKLLDKVQGIEKSVVICQHQPNNKGENHLVAFYVNDKQKEIKKENLIEILKDALPDYMLPSAFISLHRLPLTSSGKIDRTALPGVDLSRFSREAYVAPGSEVEQQLARIWSQVLGINKIGILDNFFELGGHSLKAVTLIAKIHKEFNVKIPLALIFKSPTIKGLSRHMQEASRDIYESIGASEKKEYYPLSSAQKRIYVLQQMELVQTSYNIQVVVVLKGELKKEKLAGGFKGLIKRHESLRTSFQLLEDEPVQMIHDDVKSGIEYYETGKEGRQRTEDRGQKTERRQEIECKPANHLSSVIRRLSSEFVRPFDLSQSPLLRVGLIKLDRTRHILMVDIHHIVSDGMSQRILVKDFVSLYEKKELPQINFQYKDYSEWQNSQKVKEAIKKQEEYWLQTFEEEIPLLKIPTDYERPDILHFEGHTITFEIGSTLYDKFKTFVSESKTTFNILLLAAYNVLLSKYTGQKTILVGNVIAGRRHADLQNIIGFFVNMLPIKNHLEDEQTFEDFAGEVKETSIKAYENQDYQFEELVSKLDIRREAGRHPLIDTVFVLRVPGDKQSIGNTSWESSPYEIKHKVSHFDLMLHATVMSDSISMIIEYSTTLFKQATIEALAKCYLNVLEQTVTNKKIKLKEITINYDIMKESSDILRDKELSFEF